MTGRDFDARLLRAKFLSERFPFARQILAFYVEIVAFQKEFLKRIEKKVGGPPKQPALDSLRAAIDVESLVSEIPALLDVIVRHAPRPLAEFAKEMEAAGKAAWSRILNEYVRTGGTSGYDSDPRVELVVRVIVEPCAGILAGRRLAPSMFMAVTTCPLCEGLPVVGILRPEGDGGKRFLACSFCGYEWEFRRILCANCGETREESLPVFVAEAFPGLRVECCDTCHKFLRTADLTKDGNAVAVVDDLAAIPLTLWAGEHGYERIHPNLLET